ncbi:MAG: invasion associated locus B family protein [Pikeienuella sp.]
MSFLPRMYCLLAVLFLSAGAAGAQTTAAPQSVNYGDWLFECPANAPTRCALTQRIINSETRDVVAKIGFARLATGIEGYAMVLSVPDGVELTTAPLYEVGQGEKNAMAWRVCVNGRCQASASVTVDQARNMQKAGKGAFLYFAYGQNAPTSTPVSFRGLSEGLAALGAK